MTRDFKECYQCIGKLDYTRLCNSCFENRGLIEDLKADLAFREQCIKDACAVLVKEPVESSPGVETPASRAYGILWRLPPRDS